MDASIKQLALKGTAEWGLSLAADKIDAGDTHGAISVLTDVVRMLWLSLFDKDGVGQ
jgi:hypothetical protein